MSDRESEPSRPTPPDGGPRRAQPDPAGPGGIPTRLERFVERHFVSGAHVEVLLLLWAVPDRGWTAAEVSRELRIDADQSAEILSRCRRSGFVRGLDGRYRYSPRTTALGADVDALARLYPDYRLAVISIIFGRASAPIRDFSNAFDLRQPKEP